MCNAAHRQLCALTGVGEGKEGAVHAQRQHAVDVQDGLTELGAEYEGVHALRLQLLQVAQAAGKDGSLGRHCHNIPALGHGCLVGPCPGNGEGDSRGAAAALGHQHRHNVPLLGLVTSLALVDGVALGGVGGCDLFHKLREVVFTSSRYYVVTLRLAAGGALILGVSVFGTGRILMLALHPAMGVFINGDVFQFFCTAFALLQLVALAGAGGLLHNVALGVLMHMVRIDLSYSAGNILIIPNGNTIIFALAALSGHLTASNLHFGILTKTIAAGFASRTANSHNSAAGDRCITNARSSVTIFCVASLCNQRSSRDSYFIRSMDAVRSIIRFFQTTINQNISARCFYRSSGNFYGAAVRICIAITAQALTSGHNNHAVLAINSCNISANRFYDTARNLFR